MPTAMYTQTVSWGRKGLGIHSTKEGAKATLEISELLVAHKGWPDNEGCLEPTNEQMLPSMQTDFNGHS